MEHQMWDLLKVTSLLYLRHSLAHVGLLKSPQGYLLHYVYLNAVVPKGSFRLYACEGKMHKINFKMFSKDYGKYFWITTCKNNLLGKLSWNFKAILLY